MPDIMIVPGCQAKAPLHPLPGFVWCGRKITAYHRYTCACKIHVVTEGTCSQHQPAPGVVGCATCWQLLGHDCEVTFEPAEAPSA